VDAMLGENAVAVDTDNSRIKNRPIGKKATILWNRDDDDQVL
jgi:hypothetical protein